MAVAAPHRHFRSKLCPYTLVPAPQDDAVLSPAYAYSGSDPDDGIVTVTGVNLPPVAVAETYTITARAVDQRSRFDRGRARRPGQ